MINHRMMNQAASAKIALDDSLHILQRTGYFLVSVGLAIQNRYRCRRNTP
jgi:hypothetical protein